MTSLMLGGAACGLGAFLVFRNSVLDRSGHVARTVRLGLLRRSREDRRILGISDDAYVSRVLIGVVVGICTAVVVVFALSALGIAMPAIVVLPVLLCGVLAPTGVLLDRTTKKASIARRTFSYALSSYLDLASVLLAGGAGSETALIAAASTGSSWTFGVIRDALDRARAERIPMWKTFADLGHDYGVADLERLAGSMQLAGEQGAKVRTSLAAQGDALRTRQIAEIEAEAQAATERMGVPTVLLFVGFIALLGYPALNLVVGKM